MDEALKSAWLRPIPLEEWPDTDDGARRPFEVWLSRAFLVQLCREGEHVRMTVNRVKRELGAWRDGISWEQIMQLKRECGRGDVCAVELFPPDDCVVNVANMRHLWLVEPPPFMWGKP